MKILSYGDNPKVSSGYGQVWDNLLTRWCKEKPEWEFYHLGWQNRDRPHQRKEGYWMLPLLHKEYGFDTVAHNLLTINPDILITLADVGWQAGFIEGIEAARQKGWRGLWFAYTPVDTHTWEYLTWNEILEKPDIIIAMSEAGLDTFRKFGVSNLKYIPHGVDTKIYKPLANRDELRKKYNIHDKFVVGFVGRNQKRKMIANLLKGFAQFSKGKNDVRLLLHSEVFPPQKDMPGWNIPNLIKKFEALFDPQYSEKIVFTKQNLDAAIKQRIQPEQMNEIYNLMDIFCFATGGEGFGLPAIECQAAGVPLMMTNNTTGPELITDHGILIPVLEDKYGRQVTEIGMNGIENTYPDDVAIANLLNEVYDDWKKGSEKLKQMAKKSREFSLHYDWDIIASKWIKLFEENKI